MLILIFLQPIVLILCGIALIIIDRAILKKYTPKIAQLSEIGRFVHYSFFTMRCIMYMGFVINLSILFNFLEHAHIAYKIAFIFGYLLLVILDALIIYSHFNLKYIVPIFSIGIVIIAGVIIKKEVISTQAKARYVSNKFESCDLKGLYCNDAVNYSSTTEIYLNAPTNFLSLLDSEVPTEKAKVYLSFLPPTNEIKNVYLHLPHSTASPNSSVPDYVIEDSSDLFFVIGKDEQGNILFVNKEHIKRPLQTTNFIYSRQLSVGEVISIEFYNDNGDGSFNQKTDRQLKNASGEFSIQKLEVSNASSLPKDENINFPNIIPANLQTVTGIMFEEVILPKLSSIVIFKKSSYGTYERSGYSNPIPKNIEYSNIFVETYPYLFPGDEIRILVVSEENNTLPNSHMAGSQYVEKYFKVPTITKTKVPYTKTINDREAEIIPMDDTGKLYINYTIPKNPYFRKK